VADGVQSLSPLAQGGHLATYHRHLRPATEPRIMITVAVVLEALELQRDVHSLSSDTLSSDIGSHGAVFFGGDLWEPLSTVTPPPATFLMGQWYESDTWIYRALLFPVAPSNGQGTSLDFGSLRAPEKQLRADTIDALAGYLVDVSQALWRVLEEVLAALDPQRPKMGHHAPFTPDTIAFPSGSTTQAALRGIQAGIDRWTHPTNGEPAHYLDQNGAVVYVPDHLDANGEPESEWLLKTLSRMDYDTGITYLVCLGKWMADTGGDPELRNNDNYRP